jgi:tetratricopeptide (TPR) repeat protein
MATEWYRCESWTKAEEEHFFAKLARARKDGRAQYLRIQAHHLVESRNVRLLEAAESLLNKILTDFPDNRVEKSMTLSQLGSIYRIRGNNDRAIHYFKQAVDFEKEFPNVISGARLNFAEVVVEEGRTEFYNEVEEILVAEMERSGIHFPSHRYIGSSVLSVIYASKGDSVKAQFYADVAESSATANTNTLWNPRKKRLGLVENRKIWLDKKVREGLRLFR